MDEPLDRAMKALKAEPPDRALDQLEPRVWRRIAAVREDNVPGALFLPVRAAAVVAALAFGLAIGGVGAGDAGAERQEVAVFSIDARLAPSTLLEGR